MKPILKIKLNSILLTFYLIPIIFTKPLLANEDFKQRFYCTDGKNGYRMLLLENDKLVAYNETNTIKENGHYKIKAAKITLKVPKLGFEEQSIQEEWRKKSSSHLEPKDFFATLRPITRDLALLLKQFAPLYELSQV